MREEFADYFVNFLRNPSGKDLDRSLENAVAARIVHLRNLLRNQYPDLNLSVEYEDSPTKESLIHWTLLDPVSGLIEIRTPFDFDSQVVALMFLNTLNARN